MSGEAPWPLFVHGSAGTGKSCAALVLLDYAGGLFFTGSSLADEMIRSQQGRLPGRETGRPIWPEQLWEEIGKTALVVLDDLGGRDRVSDFAYEVTKRLLDEREGKPLVVTSNLGPARLAQLYDDRVVSRLVAGTVLEMAGADRRLS